MKKLLVVIVLLALAGTGGWLYYRKTAKTEEKKPDPTAKVERGTVVDSVTADGKVVSNLDVEIKCKASGTIIRLPLDVSDSVKKGDLLVQLDPIDEERSVRQQEAALRSSTAKVETARQNLRLEEANIATQRNRAESSLATASRKVEDLTAKLERTRELLDKKLAAREEYDTAETSLVAAKNEVAAAQIAFRELEARQAALEVNRQQIKVAESQVEIDRIQLEVARQRLADTRVHASMDGVVTSRKVQVGQIISSPISNVGGGTTILTLSDLSRIFVLASVDESDIGKVALGQKASIRVDAFPGKKFEGEVVQVSPMGVNVSNVVTFQVKIEVLSQEKRRLLPEMTATSEIIAATAENALFLPNDTVFRANGKPHVQLVAADGTKSEREVKVGISSATRIEIKDGLAEGDTVVLKKADAESRWRGPGGPPNIFGGARR